MRLVAMVKFITGDLLKSIKSVISRGVHSFESLFLLCKKIVRLGGQGIRSGELTKQTFLLPMAAPKESFTKEKGLKSTFNP